MKTHFYIIPLLFLSACYPSKRAAKEVVKAHAIYPEVTAKFCAEFFPVKETEKTTIEYRPGQTIYQTDTTFVDCDTPENKGKKSVPVIYSYEKGRIDTFFSITVKEVENTAKITMLNNEVNNLQASNDDYKRQKKRWQNISFIFIALSIVEALLIYTIFKLKKTNNGN